MQSSLCFVIFFRLTVMYIWNYSYVMHAVQSVFFKTLDLVMETKSDQESTVNTKSDKYED